jgi:hypothetical protein
MFLSKAFRNTPRGDLPVSDYASKLRPLADDLAAIGCPVDERDLTAQFIDDLGKKFRLQAEILKGQHGLTFADACARLQLAEVDEDSQQTQASVHALAVHGGGRGQPGGGGGAPVRPPGVSPNYRDKNPIPGF